MKKLLVKHSFWICLLSLVLVSSMTYGQGTVPAKALKDYSLVELKQKRDAAAAANATAEIALYDQAIKLRTEIDAAVKIEDFDKANALKEQLNNLKPGGAASTSAPTGREKELTDAINKAVAEENYEKADALKKELEALKNGTSVTTPKPTNVTTPTNSLVTPTTPSIPQPIRRPEPRDTFQYRRFGWTAAFTTGLYGVYNPAETYVYGLETYRTVCAALEVGVRQRTKRLSFGLVFKLGKGLSARYDTYYTSDLSTIVNPPDGYSTMEFDVRSEVSSIKGLKLELSNSLYGDTRAKFFYALGAGIERQTVKNDFTNGTVTFSNYQTSSISDFNLKTVNNALAADLIMGPAFRLGSNRQSAHLVVGVGGSFFFTPVRTSDSELISQSSGALKVYIGIRR